MKSYFLSFISLFVTMDVIGTLPIFINLTEGVERRRVRTVTIEAIAAGATVAILFMFGGKWLFRVLGVTIADFRVAGGLLLLVFAIHDLLFARADRKKEATMGVVPIGIPLLVGPAVLTGLVLAVDTYGYLPTLVSLGLNLGIAFLVFYFGHYIIRVVGEGGSKGIGKVASLLLAAIAVMMIRSGVEAMIRMK
jgi:multiple antibiotic resistance protein